MEATGDRRKDNGSRKFDNKTIPKSDGKAKKNLGRIHEKKYGKKSSM